MSTRLLIGTRKGLFTARADSAGDWQLEETGFLGDPVTMVLHEAGGHRLYAALDHGHFGVKLHRSRDAGASWEEVGAPQYPPKPEDAEDLDPMRNEPVPWDLKRIWALESSPDGRTLWCGTMPGGLFRSDDAGASWQLSEALWQHPVRKQWFGGGADYPGIHSILIDPRDPRRITVAVSCGGVWHSDDAGGSWHPRTTGMWADYLPPERREAPTMQDPHRVVQCLAAPDVWWAQHHNGVFRSEDAGRRWQEIEKPGVSRFGFGVAVHPRDPDTAWFVPAEKDERRYPVGGRLVVTRTRDGGRTYEVLRDGLPQHPAYDLVYRHALDVDQSGERVAFGSTTGGLWLSEDQGEHWRNLSSHLPPVYCVRFT